MPLARKLQVYGLGLIGQEQGGEYLTYHSDFRGSTVALTDANAQVTELFQYSPYGVLVRYHAETTPFLFNGMSGVMTDSHPSPISVLVRGEKEMPSNNGMSPSFLTFLVALLLLLLMTGFAFVTGHAQYYIASVLHDEGYFLTARYFYQQAIHREVKGSYRYLSYRYLGVIYLHGQGVAPNAQLALEYFEKAIKNGDVDIYFAIGGYFLEGTNGFELNPLKAYYWYKVSECQTGRSTSFKTYWILRWNPHLVETIKQKGDPCDYMYTDFANNLGPSTATCEQWLKGK